MTVIPPDPDARVPFALRVIDSRGLLLLDETRNERRTAHRTAKRRFTSGSYQLEVHSHGYAVVRIPLVVDGPEEVTVELRLRCASPDHS